MGSADPKATEKKKKGWAEEERAAKFLAELGYRIVKRNFKYGNVGEIDIVALDGDVLVFVEVKGRDNYNYGTPEESINVRKQAQLKRVARFYYHVNGIQEQVCRFDVVAIDNLYGRSELRHHIGAFV
jgi:putative endonuclease